MNDVQEMLAKLQLNGWTLSAIADDLGVTVSAVEKWKAGTRYPGVPRPILVVLNGLADTKPPPKRRYPEGHYLQRRAAGKTDK